MASVVLAQFSYILGPQNLNQRNHYHVIRFCHQFLNHRKKNVLSSMNSTFFAIRTRKQSSLSSTISFSAANKPSSSSEISLFLSILQWRYSVAACFQSLEQPKNLLSVSDAKIRSEVLSPFRSVRMFFYLAFVASAGLGGLIATTQLTAALTNPARADAVPDILKGLGIDIGAASIFAFLYSRENSAKNAQLARLSREENLSNLKLRVDEKKTIPVSALRGVARLVICAGPASFIKESFKRSKPLTEILLDRGVLVEPYATNGNSPSLEFEESEEMNEITVRRKRLWQLTPVYVS